MKHDESMETIGESFQESASADWKDGVSPGSAQESPASGEEPAERKPETQDFHGGSGTGNRISDRNSRRTAEHRDGQATARKGGTQKDENNNGNLPDRIGAGSDGGTQSGGDSDGIGTGSDGGTQSGGDSDRIGTGSDNGTQSGGDSDGIGAGSDNGTQSGGDSAPVEQASASEESAPQAGPDSADPEAHAADPEDGPKDQSTVGTVPKEKEAVTPTLEADLRQLKDELHHLKAELLERQAVMARLEAERTEFESLYPDVAFSQLPDEVWEMAKRGVPIAASYALNLRKKELLQRRAEEENRRNNARSAGTLDQTENNYFTPEEVRSMTPSEVHRQYQAIMKSMQKWH